MIVCLLIMLCSPSSCCAACAPAEGAGPVHRAGLHRPGHRLRPAGLHQHGVLPAADPDQGHDAAVDLLWRIVGAGGGARHGHAAGADPTPRTTATCHERPRGASHRHRRRRHRRAFLPGRGAGGRTAGARPARGADDRRALRRPAEPGVRRARALRASAAPASPARRAARRQGGAGAGRRCGPGAAHPGAAAGRGGGRIRRLSLRRAGAGRAADAAPADGRPARAERGARPRQPVPLPPRRRAGAEFRRRPSGCRGARRSSPAIRCGRRSPRSPTRPIRRPTDAIRLLVLGGSLGARVFSDVVPTASPRCRTALRARLAVVQQCRAEDLDRVRAAYDAAGIAAELSAFFPDVAGRLAVGASGDRARRGLHGRGTRHRRPSGDPGAAAGCHRRPSVGQCARAVRAPARPR